MSNAHDRNHATDPAYQVGYKRPPKQHQFQKGSAANPKGRPKKKTAAFDVRQEMEREVKVRGADGKYVKVPYNKALLRQMQAKAVEGHPAALRFIFAIMKDAKMFDASVQDQIAARFAGAGQRLEEKLARLIEARRNPPPELLSAGKPPRDAGPGKPAGEAPDAGSHGTGMVSPA